MELPSVIQSERWKDSTMRCDKGNILDRVDWLDLHGAR